MLYIYTICYNTPQFIEPQFNLFKKFIVDDFEFIVFNNTMTDSKITQHNIDNDTYTKKICYKYQITVIDVPSHLFGRMHSSSSLRAGTAIDYANQYLFANYDTNSTFFLIDSDAFLIRPFNVEVFMSDKKISGRIQYRKGHSGTISYITNQLVIYKPSLFNKTHFSFMPCTLDGATCDCGGPIHELLSNINSTEFINWTNILFSDKGNITQQWGTQPDNTDDFCRHFNDVNLDKYVDEDTVILNKKYPFCEIFGNNVNNTLLIHMRAGTNWIGYDITSRNALLLRYLSSILTC